VISIEKKVEKKKERNFALSVIAISEEEKVEEKYL
jgi:hypothetical protein